MQAGTVVAREVAGGEDWGGRGAEEGAATRAAPLAWAQWEESMADAKAEASREVHPVSEAGEVASAGEGWR